MEPLNCHFYDHVTAINIEKKFTTRSIFVVVIINKT